MPLFLVILLVCAVLVTGSVWAAVRSARAMDADESDILKEIEKWRSPQ